MASERFVGPYNLSNSPPRSREATIRTLRRSEGSQVVGHLTTTLETVEDSGEGGADPVDHGEVMGEGSLLWLTWMLLMGIH